MKHTPLFDRHTRDASAVINLKGVARAMHYSGHLAEHRAVREGVSVCDVSHMGELDFKGPDALALVQKLITNDASKLAVDQALYSVMCTERGTVIDDLVCFRLGESHFRWVVNVTKIKEDYEWVLGHVDNMDVKVSDISTDTALLALQGPLSLEVLQRITKADLSTLEYYRLVQTTIYTEHAEVQCIISRTGYTGERGFEIMIARDMAPWVWDELLMAGRPLGIVPHGVAARESLRTEAGYLLNGNDMDAGTNPFEAGLSWVVKLGKDFVGKQALARIKASGVSRKIVGLEMEGRCSIRHGYSIYRGAEEIGRVTSGPVSPDLSGRSIGLGYVGVDHAAIGTEIEIDVRGQKHRGRVGSIPFVPRRAKDEPGEITYSPCALRYSCSHVWVHFDDQRSKEVRLGLSDFCQRSLGDILYASLPAVGDRVVKGVAAGWLDSYRRAFDLISPVSGEVVGVEESLLQKPGLINSYPYRRQGILRVRVDDLGDLVALMSFEVYADQIRQLRRYEHWSEDLRTA